MKYRPPLRTPEILAYNWGVRGRREGLQLADLEPLENYPPRLGLTVRELEALAVLGPDAWNRWAFRGWAETLDPGPLN
jgi:hypothetical protein